MSHDVKYNAKKSAVMIFRSATLKGCSIPEFKLKGVSLHVVVTINILETIFQMSFQMIMILIDNAELYMYKVILYCENLACAP